MKMYLILLSAVIFCSVNIVVALNVSINEDICGLSYSDRIVGGKNASLGQYPWIARLGYNKTGGISYECGGALITRRHILTATHCIKDSEPYMVVRIQLGEYNIDTEKDCFGDLCSDPVQIFVPEEIVVPKEYNDPKMKHDIALIKLSQPVKYTNWIRPICLPTKEDFNISTDIVGMNTDVAGWGLTHSHDAQGASILQTVNLPIVNISRCQEQFFDLKLGAEQLCAGGEAGKDSCSGDSGGAMQRAFKFRDKGPRFFQLGIVSLGARQCGKFATAALYTNVSYYIPWILKNIKV